MNRQQFGKSAVWGLQSVGVIFLLLILWQIVSMVSWYKVARAPVKINKVQVLRALKGSTPETSTLTFLTPLFGEYVPHSLDATGVKASDLQYVVVGIMYAEDESESQVLIRLSDGHDHLFHLNDELPGGGVIKRITAAGILVFRDGLMERLDLPRDELTFDTPPSLAETDQHADKTIDY